jgi:hypothetical protein
LREAENLIQPAQKCRHRNATSRRNRQHERLIRESLRAQAKGRREADLLQRERPD